MFYETKQLILAIYEGNLTKVKQLLAKFNKLEDKDVLGRTPLCHAVLSGQVEMVELLLSQGASPLAVNRFGVPMTFHAISKGQIPILQVLAFYGADFEQANRQGYNALHWAIKEHQPKVANYLIATLQVDGNAKTAFIDTPLHLAIQEKQYQTFVDLLSCKAELNVPNSMQMTPLGQAAMTGDVYAIKQLLDCGAKPIVENQNCAHLDEIAAEWGHPIVFEYLAQEGIPIFQSKNNPIDIAAHAGHLNVLQWFVLHHYTIHRPQALTNAIRGGHFEVVKYLIAQGTSVETCDTPSETFMHAAARCRDPRIAAYLIAHQAPFQSPNHQGNTPLHLAVLKGHQRTVEILIAAGANPNTPNNASDTPLSIAAAHGNVALLRCLLEAGANPSQPNKQGKTALDIVNLKIETYQSHLLRGTRKKHQATLMQFEQAKQILLKHSLITYGQPKEILFTPLQHLPRACVSTEIDFSTHLTDNHLHFLP